VGVPFNEFIPYYNCVFKSKPIPNMSSITSPLQSIGPYMTGISIILVQLGGRFLTDDFTPS
jgi:hypothetical protein